MASTHRAQKQPFPEKIAIKEVTPRRNPGLKLNSLSLPRTKVSTIHAMTAARGSLDLVTIGEGVIDQGDGMK